MFHGKVGKETSLRKGSNGACKALGSIKKKFTSYARMTNKHLLKLLILAGVQKHPIVIRARTPYVLEYLNKTKCFYIFLLLPGLH